MHNPYMFRVVMPLPYTPGAFLFTKTNITDFLKRFKDMTTDYGLSDDRKIQRAKILRIRYYSTYSRSRFVRRERLKGINEGDENDL